ncbi:MAG: hypothetical protein HQL56_15515 [Magnetococcales bacterium]|nr:hypothetical protein [Magnetococcales bacterium]
MARTPIKHAMGWSVEHGFRDEEESDNAGNMGWAPGRAARLRREKEALAQRAASGSATPSSPSVLAVPKAEKPKFDFKGADVVKKNVETYPTFSDWYRNILGDGDWNYKSLPDARKPPGYSKSELEALGNQNFGATCMAQGFSEEACKRGGGAYQAWSDLKKWFKDKKIQETEGHWFTFASENNRCFGEPKDDCAEVDLGIKYYKWLLETNQVKPHSPPAPMSDDSLWGP